MELMTSLLLCALAALLPQTLGKSSIKFSYPTGFNDSVIIKKKQTIGKNIILNKNPQSMAFKISDLQSVFMDPTCKGCFGCMERAITAYKMHSHAMDTRISENIHNDFSLKETKVRDKRKANTDTNKQEKKSKKSKVKKNKSITITKYNDDDKIYALKIKETNPQLLSDQQNASKTVSTCQVYSVQKSFSCESPEADLILTSSKRKINKKGKKKQGKRETNVPESKATVIAPVFRKRQIDNTQVPEQIMPSIEEMY